MYVLSATANAVNAEKHKRAFVNTKQAENPVLA